MDGCGEMGWVKCSIVAVVLAAMTVRKVVVGRVGRRLRSCVSDKLNDVMGLEKGSISLVVPAMAIETDGMRGGDRR